MFISNDGEGIMLKDLRVAYGQGWYKVKRSITQDVFVIGYKKTKYFTVRFGFQTIICPYLKILMD